MWPLLLCALISSLHPARRLRSLPRHRKLIKHKREARRSSTSTAAEKLTPSGGLVWRQARTLLYDIAFDGRDDESAVDPSFITAEDGKPSEWGAYEEGERVMVRAESGYFYPTDKAYPGLSACC